MLDRREFLKLSGATAFAALFAGCDSVPKKIIPFVIPPEDSTLGEALWYASVCRQCPAGCGILVRVSEGRAKKIEGNPLHPVNRGRLCARGQAALQALYHPERLSAPLKRDGKRGSGTFVPVSWEEALSLLMANLQATRAADPRSLLLVTGPIRGHENLVAGRFLRAFGSTRRVSYDPYGQDALLAANEAVFGIRSIPEYDIANARYLLSFSGDFLETWLSPVHYAAGYGRMRQERVTIRGKFAHFGSRLSMTAAAADLFLRTAPGTEGTVALGIAHLMVRERLTPEAASAGHLLEAGLSEWSPERVAKESGVPVAALFAIAREFAGNRPGIAIAGTAASSATNGTGTLAAVALLNRLAGSVGKPGGILFPDRRAPFSRYGAEAAEMAPLPESGYGALLREVEAMRSGAVRMAILSGPANPAFILPPAVRFEEALGKVPFTVAVAPFLDETSSLADLVLPAPTFLEEWGDDIAPAGHAGNAVGLVQPVVSPFHDTRSLPDILIAAAKELGGTVAAALPWRNFRECIENAYGGPGERMEKALREGGIFSGPPARARDLAAPVRLPGIGAAAFEGDPEKYPLILTVYPSIAFYDGRGANLPWLQEMPDPVTTAVWRNWIELHPDDAAKRGLRDGDGVRISSPFGAIEAHVAFHPGIAPGTAAMPLGQGHTRYGKVANGRGGNPFALLPAKTVAGAGSPALQSVRVAVAKATRKTTLVRAGHPEGQWKMENIL
ncbi:MAG: molybdopterin-dependent oxidoreductase [Deltaproteobacteria bacterium]